MALFEEVRDNLKKDRARKGKMKIDDGGAAAVAVHPCYFGSGSSWRCQIGSGSGGPMG